MFVVGVGGISEKKVHRLAEQSRVRVNDLLALHSSFRELSDKRRVIALEKRESLVVHGDDDAGVSQEPGHGKGRLFRPHGEVASNRQAQVRGRV